MIAMKRTIIGFSVATIVALSGPVQAAQYLFQLHNHPDGQILPPPYGARIDELFDPTAGYDQFTFNFDATGSDMKLLYDDTAQTVHIYGVSLGGLDIGGTYANDSYLGIYTFDFLYNTGIGQVPLDDDTWALPPNDFMNGGTLTAPASAGGQTFNLLDKGLASFGYTFRFGNEDDDLGHRGFNGTSGWGWLEIDGAMNVDVTRDWLFTAELIPEPATGAFVLLGLGALIRRRNR